MKRPVVVAASVQLLAGLLVLAVHRLLALNALWVPIEALVLGQGVLAAALGCWRGLAPWWLVLNGLFVPGLWLASQWPQAAPWAALGFVLLLLMNWNSVTEQVPLYLTGRRSEQVLMQWLDTLPEDFRLLDLGCGLGGTLCRLAKRYPRAQLEGVETAPLSFVLAWLRALPLRNCQIHYKNLWHTDLQQYDALYCFLSPQPMPRLWAKVQAEGAPGALFISNSFSVPGVPADEERTLNDWRASTMYLWRLPSAASVNR